MLKVNAKNISRRVSRSLWGLLLLCFTSLWIVGCNDNEKFTQQGATQFFTQDFIPELLDIVWMVNDRSPMYYARDHLISEAQKFFLRLDGSTNDYRMAFISADNQLYPGLKPRGNPVVLTKGFGTVDQRVGAFGSIISQVINLQTGGLDQGFASMRRTLTQDFIPRPGIPLVMVYISDSDDWSDQRPDPSVIDTYKQHFIDIKGGDEKLLRVYAINYTEDGERCTGSQSQADIDQPDFEDRYFELAKRLNGETADICEEFADTIDLSGLKLSEPKTFFPLNQVPDVQSLRVLVSIGEQIFDLPWTYDAVSNGIRFTTAPPEGSTIQVTFFNQSGL